MTDPKDDRKSEDQEEVSFAELFESYHAKMGKELNQGDLVDGKIISIGSASVYIDTGTKSDGVVDKAELLDADGQLTCKVGDRIKLYVVSMNESEIILSKAISGAGQASMLSEASRSRTPVEGKVTGVIKGGYSVDIMGKRAFCPVSQMDLKFVENQEEHVGKTYRFIISRYEEGGKNIVVSRRELLNEELREKLADFLDAVKEGDTVSGRVVRLVSFGAFVELIQGVEGMVHVSEMSWSRVEKPEEMVQVGDALQVKILKIEPAKESGVPKISLSMKQTASNPWDRMGSDFQIGDQVYGKVVRLTNFGAFVEIAPGVDGLVHISEMSHTKRILRPEEVVKPGDQVHVVIKAMDLGSKRISLSIKDALGDPWTGISTRYATGSTHEGRLEKREKFGLFITLEPGVTGLMPSSHISQAANPSDYEKLKPGDKVMVSIQEIDEEKRRVTLISPDQKDPDNWKQYTQKTDAKTGGTMESLFLEAMKKKGKNG